MYILRCADGSLVTGTTWNLSHRLGQSQWGVGRTHTAWRWPADLVYVEEFERIDAAFYRERQVHGWKRERKERLIIEGSGWKPLQYLE
jgi:putative endonuclease